jgi:hypothetical protein
MIGFAVSLLLVGSVLLVPVPLLPIWLVATSFVIRRRRL